MTKDERKRPQEGRPKKTEPRQRGKARRQAGLTSWRDILAMAAEWPLVECLVTRDWKSEGEIVQVLVARQAPTGKIAAVVFLVDLGCLGVKNINMKMLSLEAYEMGLRETILELQPMVSADLNLVAKIIREGVAYARQFGFTPYPDYENAALIFADANPDAARDQIPLGKDGKPFFIAGPYDNAQKIMAQLEKAVGAGNFHFVVTAGPPPGFAEDF